jgi:ATP-dependent protease HslVU (ClpYQ) peptidase subunit
LTLIVGLVHEGKAYLACDSCASDGHLYSLTTFPKLFVNDNLLIGYTGSFRMAQLIEYDFDPPKRPPETPPLTYLVRYMIGELRRVLKDGGFTTVHQNEETGAQFMLVLDNQLFTVQSDFSVLTDRQPFIAVGSGTEPALGALRATAHLNLPPKERLLLALQAAESMVTSVRGPFFMMQSGDTEAQPLRQEV